MKKLGKTPTAKIKNFLTQKVLVEANCTHSPVKLCLLWIHTTKEERRALFQSIKTRLARRGGGNGILQRT